MFAGLCFMVNDKKCVGVRADRIMVRLDPAVFDEVIEKEGCEPMNFSRKIMRGFVFVNEDVLKTKKQLEYWVNLGLDYNKFAKSSKKPTKILKRTKKQYSLGDFVQVKIYRVNTERNMIDYTLIEKPLPNKTQSFPQSKTSIK